MGGCGGDRGNRPSNELQLSVGNAMFVQEELKLLDKFREDARVLYSSEAFPTEFSDSNAAMKLINDYVKNKTQGKIEDLFKNLNPLTKRENPGGSHLQAR